MLSLIFSFSLCLSHLHIHRQHMLTKLQTLLLFWHLANSAKSAGSLCLLLLLWYHTHCFQGDIYKTSIICFASEMHCFPAEQRLTSMAEKMMNNSEAACPDVLLFPSLKQFQEFLHSWCFKIFNWTDFSFMSIHQYYVYCSTHICQEKTSNRLNKTS